MARARQAKPGNPTAAIAYLRCSTARQDLSPEAQRKAIEKWANTHGVNVLTYHFDRGVSGTADIEQREQLVAALANLKTSKAGVLVVARRDRLARDGLVAQLIERAASQVGAVVVSADGLGNGDDPADRLLRGILDHVAAYEAALIRSRIRGALAVKKARGERVGAVPYGWALHHDAIHLVPVRKEQVVIELASKLRLQGATYRAVAGELRRLGHVSRTGRVFDPQQVRRMVRAA